MTEMIKRQHIVVVTDNVDFHQLAISSFHSKYFQITCFLSPELAIEESLKTGNSWDVILSELIFTTFSTMSGNEFAMHMKNEFPKLPTIILSSQRSSKIAVEAVKNGAYDFILKPIHLPQLKTSVERALQLSRLKENILELKDRVQTKGINKTKMIGNSQKFLTALDIAKRVATSTTNIFISGESGTGKEVFARFIHSESKCNQGPFIAINCSAIPENLLESELFGHAKGAFTGAQDKKIGLFEEAQNGTLFLDEIGDLSLSLQAKLLRVLQEKKIKRVGENQFRPINCRIISATHKDLIIEVNEKRFREDLFFRVNVIPIEIPPLRERQDDLLPLAQFFLKKFTLENGSLAKSFSDDAIHFILEHQWRGNVRELENAIERAVVLCYSTEISLEDFIPTSLSLGTTPLISSQKPIENTFSVHYENHLPVLDDIVQQYIEFAIKQNGGARDKTAREIGIDRKTLYKRINPELIASQLKKAKKS